MAATRARSTLSSPDLGSFRARGRARGATRNTPTVAAGLGLALAAALAYAVFASGAIGVPEETRLQIGVAVIALATLAVLTSGGGLRVTPAPLAGGGLALLAGFAVWSGLSAAWSVSPDESWLELNRAITYTLVASLGVVLGSSLPRAAERVALGYLALAALAAAYALGGKLFPWLEIPGLIDLDHTADFSRLRAPLEYWNALGLACVLAIPIAVRAAADLASSARLRTFALVSLVILLITLMLTYSRGGLLVLMIGLVLLVAMSTDRLRLAAVLGAGVLGALPGFLVGVMRDDLTRDGLSASARTDDGLILALAVAVGVAITVVLGVRIARAGERLVLSPKADRRARRAGLVLVAALALLALGALAVSERGVTGTVSNTFQEFTEAKFDKQNDPARVLKTNSGNRWIWWEEAAGAFSDRPLVGFGAGSFPLVHRLYRDNTIEVRQPHNVPLEFLSETGLIGAGLGLGGLALLGVVATRTARRGGDPRERAYAVTMVVGAAAWGLHTLVDWDWDIPGVTLPVLLFLGVLAARPPSLGPTHRVGGGRRPVRFVLGAAALVAVMALAALPALSEKLTDDALTQAATNTKADLDEAGRKAALAKRLNPFAVEPVFAQAAIAERGNQAAAAGDLLVDAVERQPDNPSTWIRLARFQVLLNDPGAAVKSLVQAARLDPAAATIFAVLPYARFDERRSASATGTPLPLEAVARGLPAPALPLFPPSPDSASPGADSPAVPDLPAAPAPAPTPRPVPGPAPRAPAPNPRPSPPAPTPREPAPPPPSGEPFRSEG